MSQTTENISSCSTILYYLSLKRLFTKIFFVIKKTSHPNNQNNDCAPKCARGDDNNDVTVNIQKGFTPQYSEWTKMFVAAVYIFLAHLSTAWATIVMNDKALDLKIWPTLPDIVLDVVPFTPWANHACEVTTLCLALVNLINVAFHKYRLVIVRRFCFIAGTLYFLRCITLFMTALPTTSDTFECVGNPNATWTSQLEQVYSTWLTAGMSIQGGHACGDYMFSGHSIILTLMIYFTLEYIPFTSVQIMARIASYLGLFFILAGHEHYTIDVVIGFYFTSTIFNSYHAYADCPVKELHHPKNARLRYPCFSFFEPSCPEGKIPNEYQIPWLTRDISSDDKKNS